MKSILYLDSDAHVGISNFQFPISKLYEILMYSKSDFSELEMFEIWVISFQIWIFEKKF